MLDLEHPRCGDRPHGDRLLARILAPGEEGWLEDGGPPELRAVRLWTLWAAKEAAFKVLSKLGRGRRVFRPAQISCDLQILPSNGEPWAPGERPDPIESLGPPRGAGSARPPLRIVGSALGDHADEEVRIEGTSGGSFVHVVGWCEEPAGAGRGRLEVGLEQIAANDPAPKLEAMRPHFTAAEWEGVNSVASARVRLLARSRLEAELRRDRPPVGPSGTTPWRVEIVTRRVGPRGSLPRVQLGGRERPDVSLSLSHHGRYVAWAILFTATDETA